MHEREFPFTSHDFERIRKLIYTYAGISLHAGKADMVYSRITRRLRATGLRSFEDYLERLVSDAEEWQHFVNSLTTNLTSFFRESHHFPILAEHVQTLHAQTRRPLKLWSAACSTGEEPYSMAMTMIDTFGSWSPPVRILATDLDTNVLEQAQAGVYSAERVERLPRDLVRRFFLRGRGTNAGMVRVNPAVRALVRFRPFNLLQTQWPMQGPFAAVFCRNVLIYFDKPTQYRLMQRLHPLLYPQGLLFVGHSESLLHAADLFRPRGQTVCIPVARPSGRTR
ncbi:MULTISPECIES: CheR family methyltransferase [Marichromatium]|uniref:Chemotaxis protein methyltransferase n=1 Tax=Marichromatium gracile TaxID=1048 RepID=A0A4V6P4Q1_MARGR|nr:MULTISPECIES: CheR family methyltransferase [Marichromatium]MBK1708968.1 chemotaxis protein CheR [Marichromatium gracile]MBO8086445.1 chemotaxis protein CheR [Marichromatium sp.]RNE92859.1 chemotaxis protein CheR [Marichromatium sp. AB32]TCW34870.1 CheR-type MCP methyltransferase [Marichromatium gracile]